MSYYGNSLTITKKQLPTWRFYNTVWKQQKIYNPQGALGMKIQRKSGTLEAHWDGESLITTKTNPELLLCHRDATNKSWAAETRTNTRTSTPNTVSATAPSKAENTIKLSQAKLSYKKKPKTREAKQESKLRHAVLCWKWLWRSLEAHRDHFDHSFDLRAMQDRGIALNPRALPERGCCLWNPSAAATKGTLPRPPRPHHHTSMEREENRSREQNEK